MSRCESREDEREKSWIESTKERSRNGRTAIAIPHAVEKLRKATAGSIIGKGRMMCRTMAVADEMEGRKGRKKNDRKSSQRFWGRKRDQVARVQKKINKKIRKRRARRKKEKSFLGSKTSRPEAKEERLYWQIDQSIVQHIQTDWTGQEIACQHAIYSRILRRSSTHTFEYGKEEIVYRSCEVTRFSRHPLQTKRHKSVGRYLYTYTY